MKLMAYDLVDDRHGFINSIFHVMSLGIFPNSCRYINAFSIDGMECGIGIVFKSCWFHVASIRVILCVFVNLDYYCSHLINLF